MSGRGRHLTIILVLCCFAQFIAILDVSIITVAIPSIGADLGFAATQMQWIVNAYTLAFGGFLLLGGRAADILGRREVFIGGLTLLGIGSLLGGAAQSEGMLIGARAVQGLGTAAIAPASLSILMTTFAEGTDRNKALAAWSAMGGVGGTLGSVIGGLLVDLISWRWVLLINVPVAVAMIAASFAFLPAAARRETGGRRHFDLGGAATITVAMVAIIYGIVETEDQGWGSTRTVGTIGLGLALVALFVLIEARLAKDPMVPLRMLRSRNMVGSTVALATVGAAGTSMWVLVSLFGQQVKGYSALDAGLTLAPGAIGVALGARAAGRLLGRFGATVVLPIGLTSVAIGLFAFTRLSTDGSYVAEMVLPIMVCAFGIGCASVPAAVLASAGMAKDLTGLASGIVNTGRQMGSSIGIAVLVTIAAHHTRSVSGEHSRVQALALGYDRAFLWGACLAVLGVVATVAILHRRRSEPELVGSDVHAAEGPEVLAPEGPVTISASSSPPSR